VRIQNIISFGCSWAFGDELIDPKLEENGMESYYTQNDQYRLANCYTGLLANHYRLTQENLSFPGSSLQSMQWNLMWWLNNHTEDYINQSIILVGLTDESRISWYNPTHTKGRDDPPWNNYLHAQWLDSAGDNVDRGWFDLHKHYMSMSACGELYQLNYETTVRMFDGIASRYGIPLIQFNSLAYSVIDVPSMHNIDARSMVGGNYKINGHPNEMGHELIANSLIKVIDNYIN
jgi:hypothetical protein